MSSHSHQQEIEREVKDLIQELCEEVIRAQPEKENLRNQLFSQACFAFSSQSTQPLLKVWENAIANMAEAQEGGMIKTNTLEATLYALQFRLGELGVIPSKTIKTILQEIRKSLYAKIQFQYDPSLNDANSDEQQIGTQGGFVLYNKGQRLDSVYGFKKLVAETLFQVNGKIKKMDLDEQEIASFNRFFNIVVPYSNSEDFLSRLLIKYHSSNAALLFADPNHYQKLKFTPWITRTGNNSKTVLEVYLEAEEPLNAKRLLSENLEERLIDIIKISRQSADNEQSSRLNHAYKSSQLRIPGWHTGSLILSGNSSLIAGLQTGEEGDKWLDKFVKTPGIAIARSLLTETMEQRFLQLIADSVLSPFLPKEKQASFSQIIKKIQRPISIQSYRDSILTICKESADLKPLFIQEKIIREIDMSLYQALDDPIKKDLEKSALHLIDTNWRRDIHDIHLCAIINPGTAQLELWEAYSNGSHLRAINQKDWLQEWELLTIPDNLVPPDQIDAE